LVSAGLSSRSSVPDRLRHAEPSLTFPSRAAKTLRVVRDSRSMKKESQPKYSRILLKLSGEALGGEKGVGI